MARLLATAVSASIAILSLATAGWAAPVTTTSSFATFTSSQVASPLASTADHAERWTLCEPGVPSRVMYATLRQHGGLSLSSCFVQSSAAEPDIEVVSMPPAPSSLAMVMSGLLALGAYHTTRVLPRLQLAHIPDWYHAGATQIGHVTPFELGAAVVELCFTAPPLSINPVELTTCENEFTPTPTIIPTRAPRSPPAAAHCA